MAIWVVRAGKYGQREQIELDENFVAIGWSDLPNLSKISSKEDLRSLYLKYYEEGKKMAFAINIGQIWRFTNEIQIKDLVAVPLKSQSSVIIGEIVGDYEYTEKYGNDCKHIRRVNWLKTFPRTAFDQDILYSFSAQMTIFQVKRNKAEERIKKMLSRQPELKEEKKFEIDEEKIDIEQYARDQIEKYIDEKFKGHALAILVEAVLNAQGYITKKSPPGPDGGIDILAAAGPLGFSSPKLCVQVKSTSNPSDVKVLRELVGVMPKVRAEQGLLVSFGGFTKAALKEAHDSFFTIRLWDAGALLDSIFRYYNQFDDEIKTELPLKRIWTMVIESE